MKEQPNNAQLTAWLHQVAQGNQSALRHLYDALAPTLYRFALSRLDDPLEAESIVSDVMLQVWQHAGRFEGRAKVKTWVLGIAHHKVMDIWRKHHAKAPLVELDTVQPERQLEQTLSERQHSPYEGEHRVLDEDCQACFEACLARLPAAQRQALYLAFVEEQSYQDIAAILDCPLNTVKTRIFHARRFMQTCMAEWQRPEL